MQELVKEQVNVEDENNEKSGLAKNSEDTTVNAESKKLLRMCEKISLTTLHGRKKGDEKGYLTYVGGGGGGERGRKLGFRPSKRA